MKFYARLNVPSRRAASIKKQVRLRPIKHVSCDHVRIKSIQHKEKQVNRIRTNAEVQEKKRLKSRNFNE